MTKKIQKHGAGLRKRSEKVGRMTGADPKIDFGRIQNRQNMAFGMNRPQKKKKNFAKTIAKATFGGLGILSLLSGGAGSAKAATFISALF